MAPIVIHMQDAVCKAPSPSEFLGHCRATEEDGIIPRVADLVAAFGGEGLPVICTWPVDIFRCTDVEQRLTDWAWIWRSGSRPPRIAH